MFGIRKTKRSIEDCKWCLFIVIKIDIVWSSRNDARVHWVSTLNKLQNLSQFEIFISLFLTSGWLHFFTRILKSSKLWPFKHNSNKFSLVFCKLLDSYFKGALSGLRQFLAIERTLKMIKNDFYFTSKAIFILKIFKFFSLLFGRKTTWLKS